MAAVFKSDSASYIPTRLDDGSDFEFPDMDPPDNSDSVVLTLLGNRCLVPSYSWHTTALHSVRHWYNNKRICGIKVHVLLGKLVLLAIAIGVIVLIFKGIQAGPRKNKGLNATRIDSKFYS